MYPWLLGKFVIKSREIDSQGYSDMAISEVVLRRPFDVLSMSFFIFGQYKSFQMSLFTFLNPE